MTVRELLKYGERLAVEKDKETSAIKLLLMHFLNKESYDLIMNMDLEVEKDLEDAFKAGVLRYVDNNEPVQYIIGYEYFYGYQFKVGADVLIPRFETEELVSHVLSRYDDFFNSQEVSVVDVGTGSGAIAISLSLEEKNMSVTATDISEEALSVAKENAANLGSSVNFISGDMLQPLIERKMRFDILVSNPPYIPQEEDVDSLVKDNEPHVALFGGMDGMFFYEQILKNAHFILKSKSMLAFEHGWNQVSKMEALIKKYFPQANYEFIKDLNGLDRITIIYNN